MESIVSGLKGVPVQVFVSAAKGSSIFRKPRTGILELLRRDKNGNCHDIDMDASFYCGDAAGRTKKEWLVFLSVTGGVVFSGYFITNHHSTKCHSGLAKCITQPLARVCLIFEKEFKPKTFKQKPLSNTASKGMSARPFEDPCMVTFVEA